MNINWNAEEYKKDFSFVHEYGAALIDLIDFKDGIKILDLGCGNGALTEKLYDLGANVTGLDSSDEMLSLARRDYPYINFRKGDAAHFRTEDKFDVVFSNAVFHWIDDTDSLLESVSDALLPGGSLVCEFGGRGCCEKIHSAIEESFKKRGMEYRRTFYFPSIGEFTPLLEKHSLMTNFAFSLTERPALTVKTG